MSADQKPFDLERVYDDEISPLMGQIIAICKRHRMPMLASFIFRRDKAGEVATCDTLLQFDGRTLGALDVALSTIRGRGPALRLTTRDADGRTLSDQLILP